jgi:hypothetical protein
MTPAGGDRVGEALGVLAELPDLVWSRRAELGITLRAAGKLSGVPFNVIKRCENREGTVTVETAMRLLRWVREGSQVSSRPCRAVGVGVEGEIFAPSSVTPLAGGAPLC